MKKNTFGRQLKRDINERKALFKNLMTSLVLRDRIQTTEPKAKAIKASVEKLVTKAKKKGIEATSELLPFLHKDAVKKMINDIAPRFSERPGGYTRIVKLGRRFGDNASTVVMEWVEGSQSRLNRDQKSETTSATITKATKTPNKPKISRTKKSTKRSTTVKPQTKAEKSKKSAKRGGKK